MNNVVLSGRLATETELGYTPSQTAKCTFTLAVEKRRRKDTEQAADFIRITVWGANAENCNRYLVKGQKAEVRGRIQTGSYKDRDGKTVYTTDVIAEEVEFGEKPKAKAEPDYSDTGYSATQETLPF